MKEKDLFNQYVNKMESIDDSYFKKVNKDLLNGQNSYLRMRMKGSSFFNDEWIKKIEDCIYELGQIVNNPTEVTTTEGSITPIELAKKINYESVQHLASHSQYIKEIDEKGNVIPAKILSQFHKEELHTYENRFIATFIRRLVLFVEKRYEFIRSTVNFNTKDILYIKNKSIVDGEEIEIETKVTRKKENDDTESKIGKEYVERVEKMRTYVNYFYNSPFMKELKTEKDVRKPILQTNIIRKNPLYHKCYETFLFIERFNSLGVQYTSDQSYKAFSEKERKELNYLLSSHLLSLGGVEKAHEYKSAKKVYKPKLLSSIDDEAFIYGDLVKGPVTFVRADDNYLKYLKERADLNKPPRKLTRHEKEYFKEEIKEKKQLDTEVKNIELLLRRIKREISKWEKIAAILVEERKEEEAKEATARLEELRKQEDDILAARRKAIIAAALEDKKDLKEAVKKAPKKVIPKKAAKPKAEPAPLVEEVKPEPAPVVIEAKVEKPKKVTKPVAKKKAEVKKEPAKKATKPKTKKVEKKQENSKKVKEKPVILKKKPVKKPVKKEAPKKEAVPKEPKNVLEAIPGKFIVKTPKGYVVTERTFSKYKTKAKIYDDFNKARRLKEVHGGKVIKL